MTLEEMRAEFRQAKDPKEQIVIIADQALMTPYEVATMLREAGEDVDRRWFAQKKNWQKDAAKEEPKEDPMEKLKEAVKKAEATMHDPVLKKCAPDLLGVLDEIVGMAPYIANIYGVDDANLLAATAILLMVVPRGGRA